MKKSCFKTAEQRKRWLKDLKGKNEFVSNKRRAASVCSSRGAAPLWTLRVDNRNFSDGLRWHHDDITEALFFVLTATQRSQTQHLLSAHKRFIWHSWAHASASLPNNTMWTRSWLISSASVSQWACSTLSVLVIGCLKARRENTGRAQRRDEYVYNCCVVKLMSRRIDLNDTRLERNASDLITGSFKGLKL